MLIENSFAIIYICITGRIHFRCLNNPRQNSVLSLNITISQVLVFFIHLICIVFISIYFAKYKNGVSQRAMINLRIYVVKHSFKTTFMEKTPKNAIKVNKTVSASWLVIVAPLFLNHKNLSDGKNHVFFYKEIHPLYLKPNKHTYWQDKSAV